MSFVYPLGLIALVGVGFLIIIYIIKSKYQERTVSSTYLWKLSQVFMKKKLPMQKLRQLLIFLLQLLSIIILAIILSSPLAIIPDAATEYVIILDASGSMQASSEQVIGGEKLTLSRFDRAKHRIQLIADEMTPGSTITLIVAAEKPTSLTYKEADAEKIGLALSEAECGIADSDLVAALDIAQQIADTDGLIETIVFSDKYDETRTDEDGTVIRDAFVSEEIRVVDMRDREREWNCTAQALEYQFNDEGCEFTGRVRSTGEESTVICVLYVDGKKVGSAKNVVTSAIKEGVVSFSAVGIFAFSSAKLELEVVDSLAQDNSFIVTHNTAKTNDVLLVSDLPLFLRAALSGISGLNLTVVPTAQMGTIGYDLYIYDNCMPPVLPTDGAIWFYRPSSSLKGCGFTVSGEIGGGFIKPTNPESEAIAAIKKNLNTTEFAVSSMAAVRTSGSTEMVLEVDGWPALLAGKTEGGARVVVNSFELTNSNLPLTLTFLQLLRNMTTFSMPEIAYNSAYEAGNYAKMNLLPLASRVTTTHPDNFKEAITLGGDTFNLYCEQLGVYTVTTRMFDETDRVYFVAVNFPKAESAIFDDRNADETLRLTINPEIENAALDAQFDIWPFLALALLALVAAEWILFYKENE